MRLDSYLGKHLRVKVCALVSAASLYVVVAGCDPQVQNALVKGLSEAAVSTLEAMFTRDETPEIPGAPTVPDESIPTVMNDASWGSTLA